MGLILYRQLIARRCGVSARPPAVYKPRAISGHIFRVDK